MTDRDRSRDRPGGEMIRLTVAEAAVRLGITEAGVRKRVQRGQIVHERGGDGRVFVWISPGETRHAESRDRDSQSQRSYERYIRSLEDQVRYLREKLDEERRARTEERRRHDTLMAQLTSRIPELEPPSSQEPSEAAREEDSSPDPREPREEPFTREGRPMTEPVQRPQERSWWRRMFGG